MKYYIEYLRAHTGSVIIGLVASFLVVCIMFYKLGSLTGGLSIAESHLAMATYGWHGIYRSPLYLPISIARSVILKLYISHTAAVLRSPSVIFGLLSTISFGSLLLFWHGSRIATLGTILFVTSAWTLHISRLGTNDVVYLLAPTLLLLSCLGLHRKNENYIVLYLVILAGGILLYIPGMVWFILANVVLQRKDLVIGWRCLNTAWKKFVAVLLGVMCLPLLIHYIITPKHLLIWAGLPQKYSPLSVVAKHFLGVPVHLFVRGPEYSQQWLGRSPVLDLFTLAMTIIGIYFYAMHVHASRTKLLGIYVFISWILIGMGGLVSLSFLVTIMYLCAAAGLAYMIRDWLKVFPNNPVARNLGLALIIIAISLSALYNIRAYFVAWPDNPTTNQTFMVRAQRIRS
jgi:hypothetical protein